MRPQQWIPVVHEQFLSSVQSMSIIEAKIKFLSKNRQRAVSDLVPFDDISFGFLPSSSTYFRFIEFL